MGWKSLVLITHSLQISGSPPTGLINFTLNTIQTIKVVKAPLPGTKPDPAENDGTNIATTRMSILIEENMNKPKKSIRVFLIIGLIVLNIVMFVMVLQRTLPGKVLEAKNAEPNAVSFTADNHRYLPLMSTVYQEAIVILSGDGVYYERDQDMQIVHVVGEVLNNTPSSVTKIMVEAVLNLKSGGQTTLRGFPLVDSLARGDRACFDLYVLENKAVESYAVKVISYATGGTTPADMAPVVSSAGYNAQDGWYSLEGTLSSTSQSVIPGDLRAVVTLYDASGRVLGCEQSYIRFQPEEANGEAAFNVVFMNRDFSQASRYALTIAGSADQ